MSAVSPTMIAVAIDDAREAWMEMLVPFLLSLRATDYAGGVTVFSYGLSDAKKRILKSEGVLVEERASALPLSTDRYLAAATLIAQRPGIDCLALYDADIWFPDPHFDLFDQLGADDRLHCAPDAWLCDFVTTPLIGDAREENVALCTHGLIERFGHGVQAGLVMGRGPAWGAFATFLEEHVVRIGQDFVDIYGLDTTLLSLYAGQGHVAALDKVYNLVPKWGVAEHHDMGSGAIRLFHDDRPVKGLHATNDIRFNAVWRYFNRHPEQALESGARFAVADRRPPVAIQLECSVVEKLTALGLHVETAETFGTLSGFAEAFAGLGKGDGTRSASFADHGGSRFSLTTMRDMRLDIRALFHDSAPPPLVYHVDFGAGRYSRSKPGLTGLMLSAGTRLTFESVALPGQRCAMLWQLEDLPLG